MLVRFLADFINQCRLAKCEEDYATAETIGILPHEHVSYTRFLCSGQEVRFRVYASASITASIGFDGTGSGVEYLPVLRQKDARSIAMNLKANRSAWYIIRIASESSIPIGCTVEIRAAKRRPSVRTKLEAAVNRISGLISNNPPLYHVIVTSQKQAPAPESDDFSDRPRATRA